MYDYFYGAESEQFSFYRIPKMLFTNERFKTISAEAKILYGLLLDRMNLSAKNGWQDKDGKVYIIFTIENIMDAMGCADQKAGKTAYADLKKIRDELRELSVHKSNYEELRDLEEREERKEKERGRE